jgi:AcrR family transcriptional regulator
MARTHGWGGSPPATDEEAVERILGASRRCIEIDGARTTVSDVAIHLGVTRQTVYRYFESTEALLYATALQATGPFLQGLTRHVRNLSDPAEAIVEALAYTIERLPHELYLGVLLRSGHCSAFASGIGSELARSFGHLLIGEHVHKWHLEGVAATRIDELVEWTLRILQSMVLDPGRPQRTPRELRLYLRRWLFPAIDSAMKTKTAGEGPLAPSELGCS